MNHFYRDFSLENQVPCKIFTNQRRNSQKSGGRGVINLNLGFRERSVVLETPVFHDFGCWFAVNGEPLIPGWIFHKFSSEVVFIPFPPEHSLPPRFSGKQTDNGRHVSCLLLTIVLFSVFPVIREFRGVFRSTAPAFTEIETGSQFIRKLFHRCHMGTQKLHHILYGSAAVFRGRIIATCPHGIQCVQSEMTVLCDFI